MKHERAIKKLVSHHFVNKTQYKNYAIYIVVIINHAYLKNFCYKTVSLTAFLEKFYFSRSEIKDIVAYLRIITNLNDDSAFLRIANMTKREIWLKTMQKLGELAILQQKSLFSASFDVGLKHILTQRSLTALQNFTHWLAKIAKRAEQDPLLVIKNLLHNINYKNWLYRTSNSTKLAEIRIKNVNQLFAWIYKMINDSDINKTISLSQAVSRFILRDMIEHRETADDLNQL